MYRRAPARSWRSCASVEHRAGTVCSPPRQQQPARSLWLAALYWLAVRCTHGVAASPRQQRTMHSVPAAPGSDRPIMKLALGAPLVGAGPVPAPPGHRCDQTGLPVRPQGATFTGQPAGCSRYTAVTRNKPLDFERGRPFFGPHFSYPTAHGAGATGTNTRRSRFRKRRPEAVKASQL